MNEEIEVFLQEKKEEYGYDTYQTQYLLTETEEGYDVDIYIFFEAKWDEVQLQSFGETLCAKFLGFSGKKETASAKVSCFVLKLQENEEFWFVGNEEKQEIVFADMTQE